MRALKDKGGHLESDGYGLPYFDNGLIEDERGIFKYKDVKEAVLKYKDFLKDLEGIGETINIKDFYDKWNKNRDRNINHETVFNEIFGNFEK
jgi:hypothetical protein